MIPGPNRLFKFAAVVIAGSSLLAFAASPVIRPVQPAPAAVLSAPNPKLLAVDAEEKVYNAEPGETNASFVFNLTNISDKVITINRVNTSCGCTLAKLPAQPWHLSPGEHGSFEVKMDLRGKFGTIAKTVSIDSSTGFKMLMVKSVIPSGNNAPGGVQNMNRQVNMQMALADRQVVLKGECASCHVTPAKGKRGKDLYVAACGICHEAVHRASMVPDLRALKVATSKDYWIMATTHGKPNSLMPAFATEYGGFLNREEIESIADYLTGEITSKSATANNLPFPKTISVPSKPTAPATAPSPTAALPPPPKPAFNR